MDQEAERLREERRVKMQEIKENMANSLWRDSATSAPSVREVDEFHEDLSAGDRRKRTAEKLQTQKEAGPKDKLQLEARKRKQVYTTI
jgi:hypothetical protein